MFLLPPEAVGVSELIAVPRAGTDQVKSVSVPCMVAVAALLAGPSRGLGSERQEAPSGITHSSSFHFLFHYPNITPKPSIFFFISPI